MSLEKSLSLQSGLESLAGKEIKDGITKKSSGPFCKKLGTVFRNITVEPMFIFYILPSVMSALIVQNLNLEKACRVNLNFSDQVCTALTLRNRSGYSVLEEVKVQKLVASMNAWKNIIQSLIPAFILMFLGSWSDRNLRRKPCVILPLIGDLTSSICLILCTYFFYQLPLEVNALAESIPPSLTGGWFTMTMAVFSYISSISTTEERTLRIGVANMIHSVSITGGIAMSGILFKTLGFYAVFCTTSGMYLTGIFYAVFFVKEVPREEIKKKENKKSFLLDFFDFEHIKSTFKMAFKSGERNRKTKICLIMILVMIIIGPIHGELNVMYLFVRYKFGWNEIDYSIFSFFVFVLHMIGIALNLIIFTKILKLDDAILGIVSCVSKILACFIYAFAPNTTIFYIGAVIEMFNGTSFIAMRSIVSKLVSPDELGKINSLFGVCEAFMPLIYGPMYSLSYKMTIDWLPGFFYILGGILTIPAVAIFTWLYLEHKKDEAELKKMKDQQESLLSHKKPQEDI